MLAELDDASLVKEFLFDVGALVLEGDAHAFVQKREFAQTPDQDVVDKLGHGENLMIRPEWTLVPRLRVLPTTANSDVLAPRE